MIEAPRDRIRTAISGAVGLLLLAALATLIWNVLQAGPAAQRQDVTMITLLLPQPLPPPPPPPRPTVRQRRFDRVQTVPTPRLRPTMPAAKTRAVAVLRPVAKPLTLDEPPSPNAFNVPQGTSQGVTIGGGGDDGSGNGCGGANLYLASVTSQLRSVFMRHEDVDRREFHVQAQLWFDSAGGVQRIQLVGSTGDADLDKVVTQLIGEINVGGNVPSCIQPITAWVNNPWDSSLPANAKNIETWMTGTHTALRMQ